MKKLILTLTAILSITLPQQVLSFEKILPIILISDAAIDTLTLFSKSARHLIYGNNTVDEQTKNALTNILTPFKIPVPTDINESRSLWPKIAGTVFANYDSLFMSKESLEQIQSGNSLSSQDKLELVTAALMIQNNFDKKVLSAFLATPIAVWTIIHLLNTLLQELKASNPTHPLIEKMTSITKFCKESFKTKTLMSLLIIGTFIFYQRYSTTAQALKLLT